MEEHEPKKRLNWIIYTAAAVIVAAVLLIIFLPRAASDGALQQTVQGTPALTPEVERAADEHANIPDPDELQAIPDIATLTLQPDIMTAELADGTAYVNWEIDPEADYYVLCVLDPQNTILQMDILWASVDAWELADYQGSRILLLRYQDMDTKDAQDDTLTGAYICETPGPVPTPTPALTPGPTPTATEAGASASRTPRPASTPRPTSAPNRYKIIVDKADHAFAVFTYDDNGEYTVKVATFPTALGRSGHQTPTGTFKISSKGKWKQWSDGSYSPFYTRYTSGLYFHGPMFSENGDKRDTLIAKTYNAIGTDASSGCMRTTVAGAYFVYAKCPAGTVVEIVSSSNLVSWPGKPAIDPAYPTWDPTDPEKPDAEPEATPTATVTATPTATPAATPTATPAATPTATPSDETSTPPESESPSDSESKSP